MERVVNGPFRWGPASENSFGPKDAMMEQETEPLVSIITPLYNKAAHFTTTIQSVLAQTYQNWEWIIVDDGSTDGSHEMVPIEHPQIRLFRQGNHGPAMARNRAARWARGDFITFLDADDEYLPHKVAKEVATLQGHEQCSWVSSGFRRRDRDGTVRAETPSKKSASICPDSVILVDDAFSQLSHSGVPVDVLFLRTAAYRVLRGFRSGMRCFEVTEFVVRLMLAYPRAAVLPDILVQINDVPGSAFKHRENQIAGLRHMAASYAELARLHPRWAAELRHEAFESSLGYAAGLTLARERCAALRFLLCRYSGPRHLAYWKEILRTILPGSLARRPWR